MAKSDIRSYSAADIRRVRAAGQSATRREAPAYAVPDDFWVGAEIHEAGKPSKAHISLRVDQEVLDWYRAQGEGHLTRMNTVLRSYMEHVSNLVSTTTEPARWSAFKFRTASKAIKVGARNSVKVAGGNATKPHATRKKTRGG